MKDIREVVNREDWQSLRKTFLNTWKKTPVENVKKLREFLGFIKNAENDKLRIVHNYVTGSGFRIGIISHPEIDILRNEIREERRKRGHYNLDTQYK